MSNRRQLVHQTAAVLLACGLIAGLLLALLPTLFAADAPTVVVQGVIGKTSQDSFFVSPSGDDNNPGTQDMPFATVERARNAIRTVIKKAKEPVTVSIGGGIYFLDKPVVFTKEDSGTKEAPVVYRAAPGEKPWFIGGKTLSGWKAYKDRIYQVSLTENGITGKMFWQLFYMPDKNPLNARRMELARFPNRNPESFRTGGFLYVKDIGQNRSSIYFRENEIPFRDWKDDLSQAEVFAYCRGGWNVAISPIKELDLENNMIGTHASPQYTRHDRYYIRNVLGALDAPGEWYHSRKDNILYFYPPDGKQPTDGSVIVPLVNDIFRLEGELDSPYDYLDIAVQKSRDEVIRDHQKKPDIPVENITFRNLYASFSEQNGFNLIGSQNINIIGCYITMIGNYGVNLGGVEQAPAAVGNPRTEPHPGKIMGVAGAGQNLRFLDGCRNCRVAGCDIYSVGADGIMLHGANNVAENNHVYECGLFDKDMANINAFGENNIITRNTLHDTPRSAAFMKGVDNVIEYNDIRYTQLEARDGGAIRMCQRNIKIRGNVVRYNLIRDTLGYGHENNSDEYYCPWYSWGIYMDDFTSGSLIYGNIIARAARSGIMIHGGNDCEMYNNIVAYAPWGFETARNTGGLPRDQWQAGNVWKNNIFYYDRIKMAGKRQEYGLGGQALSHGVHEDIIRSDKNLYWAVGEDMKMQIQRKQIDFSEWQAEGWDQNSIVADPQFVDPGKDDFRLKKTSPAFKLGFTETDHSRIGCYQSDERLTWPLQNVTLPQEIPYVPSKQKLSR